MVRIQRNTKIKTRFHPEMGALITPVTTISKTFLGIPIKTLYSYRKTYHGKIKDCNQCKESIV